MSLFGSSFLLDHLFLDGEGRFGVFVSRKALKTDQMVRFQILFGKAVSLDKIMVQMLSCSLFSLFGSSIYLGKSDKVVSND